MANINEAFRTDEGVSLGDINGLFSGTDDPSQGAGEAAPRGSLFLQQPSPSGDGTLWIKYGDADTNWFRIGTGDPRYAIIMGYDGNAVAPKWIELFHSIASNESPFVVASASEINELSVAVSNTTTATFGLYKNGTTLVDTLTLTAGKIATKVGLSYAFAANDTISVKIASGSAKNIVYTIFIRVV